MLIALFRIFFFNSYWLQHISHPSISSKQINITRVFTYRPICRNRYFFFNHQKLGIRWQVAQGLTALKYDVELTSVYLLCIRYRCVWKQIGIRNVVIIDTNTLRRIGLVLIHRISILIGRIHAFDLLRHITVFYRCIKFATHRTLRIPCFKAVIAIKVWMTAMRTTRIGLDAQINLFPSITCLIMHRSRR